MGNWPVVKSLGGATELLPLFACLVLAGCSRGPYSPTGPSRFSATSASSTTTARIARTRFLAFGDSLTSGEVTVPLPIESQPGSDPPSIGLVVVPTASYPTQLFYQLAARYRSQAPAITVANAGLGGERADQGAVRFGAAFTEAQPQAVLLLEGVNGIGDGPDPIIRALGQMIAEAKRRGAVVFLGTMIPTKPGIRTQSVLRLQQLNDRIRALASTDGAVLVDLYDPMLPDVDTLIGVDGLHPTEAGYKRMAEIFFASIRSELEVK